MSWRQLFFLPIAALAVGTSAKAPRLKPEIPGRVASSCAYRLARESYLLAYGYKIEDPEKAAIFCQRAKWEILRCGPEARELQKRINGLCQGKLFQ